MKRVIILINLIFCGINIKAQYLDFEAIQHSHSHNDYLKTEPLWGALKNGCTSIEIDVFTHKNQLKIAHVGFALNIRDNIQDLYFKPLAAYLKVKGTIYPNNNEPLILMVQFNTDTDTSLKLLNEAIAPYKEYFTYLKDDSLYNKELKLVITGRGFNYNQVKDLDSIFVFLDGSVNYCETDFPEKLVPRGSAKYKSHFKWKGKGEMPEEELIKLRAYIAKAKECNKKLRFYAMPENINIWRTFLNEGAYWINVDNSKLFKDFYLKYTNETNKQ